MYTTTTWPNEIKKIVGDLLINIVQANIGNEVELAANRFITQDLSAWLEHGIAKAWAGVGAEPDAEVYDQFSLCSPSFTWLNDIFMK